MIRFTPDYISYPPAYGPEELRQLLLARVIPEHRAAALPGINQYIKDMQELFGFTEDRSKGGWSCAHNLSDFIRVAAPPQETAQQKAEKAKIAVEAQRQATILAQQKETQRIADEKKKQQALDLHIQQSRESARIRTENHFSAIQPEYDAALRTHQEWENKKAALQVQAEINKQKKNASPEDCLAFEECWSQYNTAIVIARCWERIQGSFQQMLQFRSDYEGAEYDLLVKKQAIPNPYLSCERNLRNDIQKIKQEAEQWPKDAETYMKRRRAEMMPAIEQHRNQLKAFAEAQLHAEIQRQAAIQAEAQRQAAQQEAWHQKYRQSHEQHWQKQSRKPWDLTALRNALEETFKTFQQKPNAEEFGIAFNAKYQQLLPQQPYLQRWIDYIKSNAMHPSGDTQEIQKYAQFCANQYPREEDFEESAAGEQLIQWNARENALRAEKHEAIEQKRKQLGAQQGVLLKAESQQRKQQQLAYLAEIQRVQEEFKIQFNQLKEARSRSVDAVACTIAPVVQATVPTRLQFFGSQANQDLFDEIDQVANVSETMPNHAAAKNNTDMQHHETNVVLLQQGKRF